MLSKNKRAGASVILKTRKSKGKLQSSFRVVAANGEEIVHCTQRYSRMIDLNRAVDLMQTAKIEWRK